MRIPRLFCAVCTALLTVAAVQAATSSPVPDTVEEDWQLVIAQTDAIGVGPQITTCMCPVTDPAAAFVAFDMNYREYPTFTAGGLQVQVWASNSVVTTASQKTAQLATAGETITWTQRMSVGNGAVQFETNNGQSTTWGDFGQGSNLSVGYTTTLTSMGGYSPDNSVARSGVTWESNYVTSMTLVQVRYYANGVLINTDTNPRSVTLGN